MNRRYEKIGDHFCKIGTPADDPNDCWPCLTPRANFLQRTIRALRRYALPSYIHPQTKHVYKSIASFRAEKNRMIYHCTPFVIHPFSMLAMIRLVFLFFFMLMYFIVHTIQLYFRIYDDVNYETFLGKIIQGILIITQFMVGYVEVRHEQTIVILSPWKIALWNLKRYTIVDVLEFIRILTILIENETVHIWINFIVFHMFCITLLHRFFISSNDSVGSLLHNFLGKNHMTLDFVSFLSLIAFCVHYLTCFRYGMPKLMEIMGGGSIPPPDTDLYWTYLLHTHKVLMTLYKANPFFERDDDKYYEVVECVTKVAVYTLHIYIVVYVLVAARNTNKSKFKYSIMWNNMQNFLKNRNISGKLRYKILAHYQHKFQFKFFEETFIIESLSQHLQYECQLHTCSHLIKNTSFLRGLPKVIIGRIVASFKPIVYLPNDVIFTWQSLFDGIYIISFGTVAIYLDHGKELMHLEDGGVIGASGYYLGTNFFTTTSVTITEIYKLDAVDLQHVARSCPELSIRLKTVGRNRIEMSKGLYSDGMNMIKLARQLRKNGRDLRHMEVEDDEFFTQNA